MNAPATAITAPLAERDSGPDPAGEMIPRTCADAVNIYEAFASGSPVIVTARGDAGFEAHMCFAGESFGTDAAAFLVRHTSGFVLATVPEEVMVRTGLTLMTPGFDRDGGRFCVAVDASAGVTTGISGADRAHTIGLLADPEARTDHFVRPGHVIPHRGRRCFQRCAMVDLRLDVVDELVRGIERGGRGHSIGRQ